MDEMSADVELRPLAEEHLPGVAAMLGDPHVMRFTRVPVPVPDGFERTWLESYEEGRRADTREAFAALDADGEFLGMALAPHVDVEAREAELGYLVAPGARGRGVATAILRRLTRWAFDERGIVRAYLLIDVENAASEKVAARAGYVREGVMRSIYLKGETRVDCGLWSRLDSDPEP